MSNGRQMPDTSHNRSAGGAVLRGALLLLVALVVGVVLLQNVDGGTSALPADGTIATADTTIETGAETTVAGGTPIVSTTTIVQRAPNLVKVLIVNGSGKNRAAARVKSFLSASGFDFVDPRDGKASNYADRVSYTPGFEAEANALGALLGLGAESIGPLPAELTVKTPPDAPAFDVQIMVGQGLAEKYANQSLTATTASTATTQPA